MMSDSALAHDIFFHVRIIMAIVLGLSLSRLINGLMRFIQHPQKYKPDALHLGWVAFIFLSTINFWWFEYHLSTIPHWYFTTYLFVIFYGLIYVALAALLFPDDLSGYAGYGDYFASRQRWFYGLLAFSYLFDIADTLLKGGAHAAALGPEYPLHQGVFFLATLGALIFRSKLYQKILVGVALVYEVSWTLRVYDALWP